MHREERISPPPQFQDPPPPNNEDANLEKIREFCSRISFDILNEAMILATEELIVTNGNKTTANRTQGSPESVTSSWEYLGHSSQVPLQNLEIATKCRSKRSIIRGVRHSIHESYQKCSDIYSLPLDNIPQEQQNESSKVTRRSRSVELKDAPSQKIENKRQTKISSILNLFKRKSGCKTEVSKVQIPCSSRALPPPPPLPPSSPVEQAPATMTDFTISIERVKDCGWYWGPLSSEESEDLLRGEPDGAFIVRDSSDTHYIFSLTFKLNGLVRHVRIQHDQGNFSFGPLTRFKASTIVDFVEKAVAHSRSGRYLFFLHRRPVLGPMRVQLLHPYSRFRQSRSLQHMCRFVILKHVRKDLIASLPLPKPLQEYLNTPHYYFEKTE